MKAWDSLEKGWANKPRLFMGFSGLLVSLSGCAELGVYTLCSYEGNWKGNVCVAEAYDPYYDFWDAMNAGSSPPYADPDQSRRLRNGEVHIQTVIPISGDSYQSWDEYDLVFFYGHNHTIVPPHRIGDYFAESYPQIVVSLEEGVCGEELWGDKVTQNARKE